MEIAAATEVLIRPLIESDIEKDSNMSELILALQQSGSSPARLITGTYSYVCCIHPHISGLGIMPRG